MTCIVAIAEEGDVYMGADAACSDASHQYSGRHPKVFRRGPFLIGYTTTFRFGQALEHIAEFPGDVPEENLHAFMVTVFIDALREGMKKAGVMKTDNGVETAGSCLVGVRGRVFHVYDLQVLESLSGFDAVGCGREYAFGSMHSTAVYEFHARDRVQLALEASAHNSPHVMAPFTILHLKATA